MANRLPDPDNKRIIDQYLEKKAIANNWSPSTVRVCRCVLYRFFRTTSMKVNVIKAKDIASYFDVHCKGLKRGYIKNLKKILSPFFEFCFESNYIVVNPFKPDRKVQQGNLKIVDLYFDQKKRDNYADSNMLTQRRQIVSVLNKISLNISSIKPKNILDCINIEYKDTQPIYQTKILKALDGFFDFCLKHGYISRKPITNRLISEFSSRGKFDCNLVERFLETKANSCSISTIKEYRNRLNITLQGISKEVSNITPADIRRYLKTYVHSNPANTLSTLSSFFDFCVEIDYIKYNPIKKGVLWFEFGGSNNRAIIELYLKDMRRRNLSSATLQRRKGELIRFFNQLSREVSRVNSREILDCMKLNYDAAKPSHYNSILNTLSCFFDFCLEEGLVSKNPIRKRWFRKIPRNIPKSISSKTQAELRIASEESALRDRVIFELLLSSGIRRNELRLINISDLNLENRSVLVHGKGKKDRTVFYSPECALLIERLLEDKKDDCEALFVRHGVKPKRICSYTIYETIDGLADAAGLGRSLGPHTLRHSFATNLCQKKADISLVKELLGHEQEDTTRIYTGVNADDVILMYRTKVG